MSASTHQTLYLHNRAHRAFAAQPVTYGVPWPQDAVGDASELLLRDEHGTQLPAALPITHHLFEKNSYDKYSE